MQLFALRGFVVNQNRLRRTAFVFFALCLFIIPFAANATEYLNTYIPRAEKIGEGRLKVFFMNVYDAELYASESIFDAEKPFAIHITYLRDIPKVKIVDRSLDEIAGQGFEDDEQLETWRNKMLRVFPDIKKRAALTGIYTSDKTAVFYHNGKRTGEITDPVFAKAFFNIWMAEDTTAPDLRMKLLGLKK